MRLVALICCVAATTGCQGGKLTRYSSVFGNKAGAEGSPCVPGAAGATMPVSGGAPGCGPNGGPGGPGGGAGACQPGQGGYPAGPGMYQQGQGAYQYGPGACQPGPGVCQPGPQVKAPGPQVKAPAPVEEVTETRRTAAAVAPDILLIPKTVLVPYIAHTPTGPLRVQGVTPSGGIVQTEERVTTPGVAAPPQVAAPNPQLNEALDQCLQQLKMLNNRIQELESRATAPPVCVPQPAPCLPLRTGVGRPFFGPAPCPPAVSVPATPYPLPPVDGFVLPAPKPLSSYPLPPMSQPQPATPKP